MVHSEPLGEGEGTFSEASASDRPCGKCSSQNVTVQEWNSEDGGYTDYKYTCANCGHVWWLEGDDA